MHTHGQKDAELAENAGCTQGIGERHTARTGMLEEWFELRGIEIPERRTDVLVGLQPGGEG